MDRDEIGFDVDVRSGPDGSVVGPRGRRGGFEFSVVPGIPAVQRIFEVAGVTELVPFRDGG